MYTAEEIEAFSMIFDNAMRSLEIEVMEDVIRRIKINGGITRSADWQLYRLYELGESKRALKKIIKDAFGFDSKEINHLYKDIIRKGYARGETLYKTKGKPFIPFEKNEALQQYISAIAEQTAETMKNISQSLGFAVKSGDKRAFKPIAKYYQTTLDNAINGIATGVFDYNTVLKQTVSEMTNSGLRTVDYETGWSNRTDVAARRAVMTGLTQVTAKINENNAVKLGTDMFEVSWHSGARPSHQVWQGRWYKSSELESVCGLGSVTGLCGANCYHSYYPVIPGISVPTYTEEELDEMNRQENIPIDYNGKQYTKYEALQRQRQLETRMRAERQKIKLLQDGEADETDIMLARAKYRGTSQEYTSFSKAMELPQQRQRVTIDGLGNIGSGKWKISTYNMSKQREYSGNTWSRIGSKISEDEYNLLVKHANDKCIRLVSFQNFDGDVELIHEMIDNANNIIRDFPLLASGKTQLQIHNSFGMDDDDFAQTIGNKIFINNYAYRDRQILEIEYDKLANEGWFVKGTDYNSIIYHEIGHAVTNVYGLSPMKIAKEVTGLNSNQSVVNFVLNNLSEYSSKDLKGREIISEVFSSVYSKTNNQFALKYFEECVKIILKRGGA